MRKSLAPENNEVEKIFTIKATHKIYLRIEILSKEKVSYLFEMVRVKKAINKIACGYFCHHTHFRMYCKSLLLFLSQN